MARRDDEAYFDEIHLSNGVARHADTDDTPTVTNTDANEHAGSRRTHPTPTNTPAATNTPSRRQRKCRSTRRCRDEHTAADRARLCRQRRRTRRRAADTGEPPEAELEARKRGAGGEQPEDAVGAGGEQPEGQEFPESGTGPGSYGGGGAARTPRT